MKTIKLKVSLIALILFITNTMGQNKSGNNQNTNKNDTSYTLASINFISDAIFMGRKDSISAPYLYPSITYHHKSGFYASGSFSYLTKSNESRIDLSLMTAGFDFTFNKFDGDISFTKYFFNEDSYNVISEVEADITARLGYDFTAFNLVLTANSYFNSDKSSDFFLSSEISHDFVTNNNKFQISPSAGIYLGTQHFYEQYYIYNRFGNGTRQSQGAGQGNGQTQGSGGTSTQTIITDVAFQESEKFNIMAIALSLPIWYVNNPFTVLFLPSYALPQTPATLTVDDVIYKENLENTFYWILGFSYNF
jgi:hypothetical protein